MNRPARSVIVTHLPVFYEQGAGCMLWGLVNGKTQTHLPWGHLPGDAAPVVWQHYLYKADHTPYDPAEVQLIKSYTGRK